MIYINENIYDMALILKIKEQTESKKLNKIIKNLRSVTENDLKELSRIKIKKLEIQKEIERKSELKNVASIIEFPHYAKDFKKSSSKSILNDDDDHEGENTPVTIDDNEEEVKQIDSYDFISDK